MYNDVWNYDDDGLFNGFEHVWEYMTVIIGHRHDIT